MTGGAGSGHSSGVRHAVFLWAADGTVYVTSMPGYLHALRPDGTEKWNHGEVDAYASPAIGCDGIVYLWGKQATSIEMPDQSVLVAIDPDGKTVWSHTRTTKFRESFLNERRRGSTIRSRTTEIG